MAAEDGSVHLNGTLISFGANKKKALFRAFFIIAGSGRYFFLQCPADRQRQAGQ